MSPETQGDGPTRPHDTPRFAQGLKTVPPDSPAACCHVKTVVIKRQMEHLPDANIRRGGACPGNPHQSRGRIKPADDGPAFVRELYGQATATGDVQMPSP